MNKVKSFMQTYNIPNDTMLVNYVGGCFGNKKCLTFFRVNSAGIYICEYNIKSKPFFAYIPRDNLIAFSLVGDKTVVSHVSGGGVSLGGALIGSAIAGPVGAILGGRKKVKTTTQAIDNRQTVIKFKADGMENSFVVGENAYDILCCNFIEKKI